MDENNEYYDDEEVLEEGVDAGVDSEVQEQQPGVIDNVSRSATHALGQTVASAYGGELGRRLYQAASNTKIGKAIEEKVAKKLSFKFKLILFGSLAVIFVIFFVVFAHELEFGVFSDGGGSSGDDEVCVNLPAIDTVCKSITPDGYATMSVDEYVAGVIAAEIGSYTDTGYDTYKSLAVAARSFALANATKDGNGNCSVPVGPSFQAYKDNPTDEMIDAAEVTSGMVLVLNNEIYSAQYDALCIESEDEDNYYLCQGGTSEEHLALPRDWIVSKTSQNYVDTIRLQVHGNGMSQNGAWYLAVEKNWTYTEILEYFYGDEGASLASINSASTTCTSRYNGDFDPLETYTLSHNGLKVLDRTLTSAELEDLNNYINDEVDKAGYGTGAGVAAAGQALVYWLEQQGYYLQYRWGGGHYNNADDGGHFIGANPNWGSTAFGTDYNNGRNNPRYYWGLDCSGFTSWVTRTACKGSNFNNLAGYWAYFDGVKHITLEEAKPGDVIDWDTHIQLVVHNNGDGTVIVAEATGGSTSGLVFSLITSPRGKVVDMSGWYANNCNSSR